MKIAYWDMWKCPSYGGVYLTVVPLIEVFLWEGYLSSAGTCESVCLKRGFRLLGCQSGEVLLYIGKFLIFLRETLFFIARCYLVVVININILIMGALMTLETRLKVPILDVFDDFGHFSSCLFWHQPLA